MLAREIVAGRNWRNLPVVGATGALAAANALVHLEPVAGLDSGYGLRLAIGAYAFLMALIGGRIVPSFTRNWLAKRDPRHRPARATQGDRAVVALTGLAAAAWTLRPDHAVTGLLAAAAALGNAWRMARWQGHRTWREPLLLVLHAGYAWLPIGFALVGVLMLLAVIGFSCFRRFWRPWLGLVWLGALAIYLTLLGGGVFGLTPVRSDLWGGLPLTLLLAVVGIVVAFPLSLLLALGRRAENMPIVKAICVGYIELIRGVPLISLLFMASFMLPLFMPTGVSIDALVRAQVAIIVFVSSYLSEVIRGGLQALPRGQYEGAQAMGLTYWQMQRKIILPQAIKISIPPIVNTYLGMFKDTSLVAIVSLTDLLLATRQSFADPEWRPFFVEGYVFIACIYWSFCYFMSKYSQYLERALSTGHKT